ncbi:MAG: signal peptidase I [Candidatus Moraniibacteriota bacterium]|nr:MAG: signal peptidase I [Candidatus Moranbacteria bacterium]
MNYIEGGQPQNPDMHQETFDEEEVYGVGRFLLEIAKIVILALVIIIPVRVFFFQPFFVQGASMEPNFHDGEYLVVGEFGYKETVVGFGGIALFDVTPFKELHRGDPVVFRPPGIAGQFFIKRVVGLPGETIEINNSHIIVKNAQTPGGFVLNEQMYLSPTVETTGDRVVTLKNDEYFLLGDNRTASKDSRAFGPVSKDRITGKVMLRAWPFDRFTLF